MGTSDMTIELLKSRLHYDPETGLFTRISKCSTKKVGKPDKDGYITIKVDGTNYQAHRLAFMYMTGRFPVITDHINRVRWDNRWCSSSVRIRLKAAQNQPCSYSLSKTKLLHSTSTGRELRGKLT